MDLQQLRYTVALSRELHFVKASRTMNVSQPTLSQQIKKLESELGAPLFERSSRGVLLTVEGEKFLPYAVSILDTLQKSIQEVQSDPKNISGTIRLGVIPTICPYLVPDVLARMAKAAPRIRVEVHEETTSVLVENLKGGKLDLGVLTLPVEHKGISVISLYREPFFVAVSRSHRLAARASIGRKELLGERLLILQEGHCFGEQSIDFCDLKRQDPQVIFQGSSLASVMAMAELGQGITFVPEMAVVRTTGSRLKFITLLPRDKTYREIGVAWRVTAPLSKAQNIFFAIIESALKRRHRSWKRSS